MELKGHLDDPRLAITGQLVYRGNHGGLHYRSVRVNTNWHFQFNINIAFKRTHFYIFYNNYITIILDLQISKNTVYIIDSVYNVLI